MRIDFPVFTTRARVAVGALALAVLVAFACASSGVNQGDFIGFEFMEDGKVLATPITAALTGGAVMYDYSVLEGGRLSLMTPDGRTVLYKVTLAGDQMELEGSMMLSADAIAPAIDGKFMSAFIRARKPGS